jgi:hypothetical protein
MQLTIVMDRPVINGVIDQNRASLLFNRPQLGGIRTIDLARVPSQPMGYVQQTGGFNQPYRR